MKKGVFMQEISVHNSAGELNCGEELAGRLGISQFVFSGPERLLPYAQKIVNPEADAETLMVVFLHGLGSVGNDNFKQLRIPAERLIRYFEKRDLRTVLLFPQCDTGFQWVDVPWSGTAHNMPEAPSVFMQMLLTLLDSKLQEFSPAKLAGLGASMGGFGIWDLACRSPRPFDALGVMCGGADSSKAPQFADTRIYMIHGSDDTAVPVCRSRDMASALRQAGCRNLIYNELPETGHNVWDPFFDSPAGLDFMLG